MANLPLAFAEVLVGAIVLDAGVKGDSIANVIRGRATQHPLAATSGGAGSNARARVRGGAAPVPRRTPRPDRPGRRLHPELKRVPGARPVADRRRERARPRLARRRLDRRETP